MPVDPATLGAFAIAAAAIVVSPGPDTILILRYALACGRSVGLAAMAGVQVGLLVHTTLAAAGVSAIIASSPMLFRALALAGALYLAWLGVQGLRGESAIALAMAERSTAARACRDAILCNVLNPKVIVLFLALYPNFLDLTGTSIALQVATLSAVLLAINAIWQVALVLAADLARRALLRQEVQRGLSRATGGILIAFAAAMLWEHAR